MLLLKIRTLISGKDLKAFIGEGRKHIRYYVTSGTKGRGYDPIPVEYTGIPFIEAGTYVMDCHMGNDSGLWIKKRYAEKRDKLEVSVGKYLTFDIIVLQN